jgi:hypothetical protein
VDLSPQLGSFLLNGRYFETIGRGKWPALLRSLPAALVSSDDSPLRERAAMPVKSILKTERPRQAVVEPLLPGRGRIRLGALPLVNAVFANDIRQLGQELTEPCILLDQRVSFVGLLVATKGRLVPAKGILKQ